MSVVRILEDDLSRPGTLAVLAEHLAGMRASSPACSVHALDVEALRDPAVTFWSAEVDGEIAGIVALKRLDAERGEIKSMRVSSAFLGRGIGRALLRHLVAEARERALTSLWLETGRSPEFAAAVALYRSEGFVECGPFADYTDDPFSAFFTRRLGAD